MSELEEDVQEIDVPKRQVYADIEINKLVSQPLKVKALLPDEKATYKLIMADFKDLSRKDSNDVPILSNPGYNLHHTHKVVDPISGKRLVLRNITGYSFEELAGGTDRRKPRIERFKFPKGGLRIIGAEDQDTYAWLERHSGNRDNPFRDKSKKAIFYRVNPVRKALLDLDKDYLLVDALQYVRNASMEQVKAIFASMSAGDRKNIDASNTATLKKGVFDYAKQNPILAMKASDDKDLKLKIAIMECEYFNLIMFNEGDEDAKIHRQWMFVDGTEICEVDFAEHKIDGLIKYFKTKEGFKAYSKVTNELRRILNPK